MKALGLKTNAQRTSTRHGVTANRQETDCRQNCHKRISADTGKTCCTSPDVRHTLADVRHTLTRCPSHPHPMSVTPSTDNRHTLADVRHTLTRCPSHHHPMSVTPSSDVRHTITRCPSYPQPMSVTRSPTTSSEAAAPTATEIPQQSKKTWTSQNHH